MSIKSILLWILIIPFFKPDITVVAFTKINYIFTIWQLISFIILVVIYLRKNEISKFFILSTIYYLVLLISTIINKGNINKWFVDSTLNVGIIMLAELNIKKNKMEFLKSLVIIFYVLTFTNTASFILFKEGMAKTELLNTPIYFLGIDNRFAFTYIPGICIIGVYDLLKNKKFTKLSYLYFAVTLLTMLYFWSAGALVAEVLFIAYYILIYGRKITFLSKYYFATVILSFYGLVIGRIQNLFEFLIVDILHKDLTFTYRTLIWDKALEFVNDNKMLGIGIQKGTSMIDKISAYHSHSNFLNVLLQSGYIGLTSYIVVIYFVFSKLNKFRNSKVAQLIAFTLFDIFIMLIFDTFDITANLFLIMCLGYNIKYIVGKDDISEKE